LVSGSLVKVFARSRRADADPGLLAATSSGHLPEGAASTVPRHGGRLAVSVRRA